MYHITTRTGKYIANVKFLSETAYYPDMTYISDSQAVLALTCSLNGQGAFITYISKPIDVTDMDVIVAILRAQHKGIFAKILPKLTIEEIIFWDEDNKVIVFESSAYNTFELNVHPIIDTSMIA